MEMQTSKITVGVVQEQDLQWVIDVAAVRMLTEELKRPELVNMNNIQMLARKGLEDQTLFIAKQGDICVGTLGGLLVPNMFNSDLLTLAEVFWYVLPEYRNTRAGFLLLKTFEEKADESSYDSSLSLLPSSTISMEALAKRGFNLAEFAFVRKSKEK